MKIVRAFMRIDPDDPDLDQWTIRMDSLLAAREIDLNEFVADAIVALSVRSGKPIEEILEIVAGCVSVEGTEEVVEMVQERWDSILAALGEHMDSEEARRRLADMARKADWE